MGVLVHNHDRAVGMVRVLDRWGIEDTGAGFAKLSELLNDGLTATVQSTKPNEYGTTVTREVFVEWVSGSNKGKNAGSLIVSYFYKGGDMTSTPEVTTIILRLAKETSD